MKMDKFIKEYLKVINECNKNSQVIKEDLTEEEYDQLVEALEDYGFSTSGPDYDIMDKLLTYAEENARTVYNKIINLDGYCEKSVDEDSGEYFVSITEFADGLYCYFPPELITDPQFKDVYIKFQTWFEETGYDGWCGFGDRGGYLDDPYLVGRIEDIFDSVTDGTEDRPLIRSEVSDFDDEEDWDEDNWGLDDDDEEDEDDKN